MNDGLLRQSPAQSDGLQAWINRALRRRAGGAADICAERVSQTASKDAKILPTLSDSLKRKLHGVEGSKTTLSLPGVKLQVQAAPVLILTSHFHDVVREDWMLSVTQSILEIKLLRL